MLEAGCWAHARRKFYDIHVKDATPITTHVLERIVQLYKIESDMSGQQTDLHGEVDIIVMNQAGDLLLVEIKAGSVTLRSTGIYKQYGKGERQVDRQVKFQYSCLRARLQRANLVVDVKSCLVLPDYRIGEQEIVGMPRDRIVDATQFDQLGTFVQSVLSAGIPGEKAERVKAFLLNELDVVKDFSVLNDQVRVSNKRISGGLATWVPRINVPSSVYMIAPCLTAPMPWL